uniref:Uncharacterized protein n=1 Tax=Favella ehrenbergii TaxID=182087 RepID=A0A7S3HZ80_9SPIT|mmetsp:Transcript_22730/g.28120  ORF Transcript_22730/g.28120 Transcript_22730/m.28120 type:complete len:202 (+) Transcript_22730:133-738(+)
MAAQEYVHLKVIDRPMKRMVAMLKLRDEMMQLSEEMNDRLKEILERFGEEAYDAETDEGLLEVELSEYSGCFSIDIEKVQTLLWSEEKRLRDELTEAEDSAERLKSEMDDFLKKNVGAMDKFLSTAGSQVKVLATSAREREEMKDHLSQLGRYDAETVEYLSRKIDPQLDNSGSGTAAAEAPKENAGGFLGGLGGFFGGGK